MNYALITLFFTVRTFYEQTADLFFGEIVLSGILSDPIFVLLVSLFAVVGSILFLRIGAFLSLLIGALIVSFSAYWTGNINGDPVFYVTRVCDALGVTAGKIGVLIVFGTIVGKCMTDSGAADRIVRAFQRLFGEKRMSAALTGSAFILSIPVFYDATFYLLLPLAKSIYRAFRKNYILYLLSVGLAATISHTTIPPTPGPIAVADAFGVPLATSLEIGLLVGICLLPIVLALAWALNKTLPNPSLSEEVLKEMNTETIPTTGETSAFDRSAPPLWLALAPIVLPVILIAGASVVDVVCGKLDAASDVASWRRVVAFIGSSNVALGIAAFISAVPLVFLRSRRVSRSQLEEKLNFAISSAGTIILITAAGGAYGEMLRGTGIGDRIGELFITSGSMSGISALTLAFLSTCLLKTAQGSSTTAMITSASIFSAMGLTEETLGFNVGYLAAAIGVGSCVASWMNDSGFCVFSRSSGVSEADSLRVWTLGTGLLGVAGFIVTLALSQLLPMI